MKEELYLEIKDDHIRLSDKTGQNIVNFNSQTHGIIKANLKYVFIKSNDDGKQIKLTPIFTESPQTISKYFGGDSHYQSIWSGMDKVRKIEIDASDIEGNFDIVYSNGNYEDGYFINFQKTERSVSKGLGKDSESLDRRENTEAVFNNYKKEIRIKITDQIIVSSKEEELLEIGGIDGISKSELTKLYITSKHNYDGNMIITRYPVFTSPYGQVYIKADSVIGYWSFHFNPISPYVSFHNNQMKAYFLDWNYETSTRTFTGYTEIDITQMAYLGKYRRDYQLVFSENFETIESGQMTRSPLYDSDKATIIKSYGEGKDLQYNVYQN